MAKYKKRSSSKLKKTVIKVDLVVISCLIVFVVCFVMYMKNTDLDVVTANKDNVTSSIQDNEDEDSILDDVTIELTSSEESVAESILETEAEPVQDTSQKMNPVPESSSLDMDYFNDCVFVGDSLTVGLSSYNILSYDNVYATIGMNIDKIDTEVIKTSVGEYTILESLKISEPDYIYIMLGSNGIAWLSSETMIKMYSDFLDSIMEALPNSKIYILSIPPVTTDREAMAEGKILNSDIDIYNSDLLKMANEKSVYFVDLNTALKNNEGKLDVEKAQKDGMHFKKATYDIMLDYILTHVAR